MRMNARFGGWPWRRSPIERYPGGVMTERFTDIMVNRQHRFSLGVDTRTGRYFLSTPISGFNRAVEYEAYYWIHPAEFERFRADPASAESFLETCRQHGHTDRRIVPE